MTRPDLAEGDGLERELVIHLWRDSYSRSVPAGGGVDGDDAGSLSRISQARVQ
jgi:hypothetical protein